jgi:mannose-1-phosphate guanylyltransferase
MLLCAGLGTRLRPLTLTLPKPLCEVAGVPLVRLALRQLRAAGVTDAVLNLHHLGDRLRASLGQEAEGVRLAYSPEETILGTGGGIRAALPLLGEGPFYVINADALQDVDLRALAATHLASGAVATLCLRADPDAERYGAMGVDDQGAVCRVLDLYDSGRATRALMFTGVHVMDPRVVAHLPPGQEACVVRQAYVPALRRGQHLHAHLHAGSFHDVGTPDRWAAAQATVLSGRAPGLMALVRAGLPGATTQPDGVILGPGVVVHPSARLLGPLVAHPGASVGASAVVGPFVALGPGARVEEGATVRQAAVLSGATARAGAPVTGVLAPGIHLPWTWPDTLGYQGGPS